MNTIKRITVICFVVLVLAANLSLCASATDPVSAATMANALAQAITAYGASQGVSMTFDVSSTDGIGEGVHELWNDFKEDIQDNNVPTYDSLAVTMWADIYTKIGNNIGININDTEMPYIDAFWNWLLSGPAEMTKVDNEYYEWTLNQNNTVDPITVVSIGPIHNQPLPFVDSSSSNALKYSSGTPMGELSTRTYHCYKLTDNTPAIYVFQYGNAGQTVFCSTSNQFYRFIYLQSGSYTDSDSKQMNSTDTTSGLRYSEQQFSFSTSYLPVFNDRNSGFSYILSIINGDITGNQLTVRPYVGDVTQDVYIPDNEDVNYSPLPFVGGLDIPWDDSLFGDGSGTLTDAQSEAIAGVVDDAITDSLEKTLTLADTENPDIPAPHEVYIPLLPVELPSFNFSLSGIWHYVVSWVQSLGAWLSLMFQTWAVLPSAITIPVYATAVIVIVLGVYKRFFM